MKKQIETNSTIAGIEKKERRQKVIGGLVISVIILILVILSGETRVSNETPTDRDRPVTALADQIGTIDMPGYGSDLSISVDDHYVNIDFYNPESNTADLKYEIVLGSVTDGAFVEEDMVYESGYIQPGESITRHELNKALAVGTYEAVINIRAYALDTTSDEPYELNGTQNQITLTVTDAVVN